MLRTASAAGELPSTPRPWEFPIRLSRLTAAALSTAVILLLTAEAWEVAANLANGAVTGLAVLALALTTIYVVLRQRLVVRRRRRLSEQTVVTNVSAFGVVLCGLLTTFGLLVVFALAIGWSLVGSTVLRSWTGHSGGVYGTMAVLVASMGIVVGALGASFEEQHHFRHVVFVDEET